MAAEPGAGERDLVCGSVVFDRAAGFYDQSRGLPAEVAEQVADRVGQAAGPGARVLEIGVGTGRISLPLHRRGVRVTGVDLSAAMMGRYRGKAAALGLPAPALVRADVTRLPFARASMDAVVEVHVLHLVTGWRLALAEARRVLAPGGVVVVGRGGGHNDDGGGPHDEVMRRFDALADVSDRAARHVGAASDDEKLAVLAALGGRAAPLEPVTWQQEESYAEALAWVDGRVFSYAWRLPDEVWQAAAAEVRAELAAEHADLTVPVRATRQFHLAAIRFE